MSASGTSRCRVRRCCTASAVRSAAAADPATASRWPEARSPTADRVYVAHVNAAIASIAPTGSMRSRRRRSALRRWRIPAATTTIIPMGRLTNSVARQEIRSVSAPLATLPKPAPAKLTAVQTAMALVRTGPSAWVVVSRVNVAGDAAAAQTPCIARATMSIRPSVASPPIRLARVNAATLHAISLAAPTTSASLAPARRAPAKPRL